MARIIETTLVTGPCTVVLEAHSAASPLLSRYRSGRARRVVRSLLFVASLTFMMLTIPSAGSTEKPGAPDLFSLEGITHYGMAIEEITMKFEKDESVLEIVYSKNLSDDNMDDYVKLLYDEMLRLLEGWFTGQKKPENGIRIVISNCKFCKIGYCKRKGVREIHMVSYKHGKKFRHTALTHQELLVKEKIPDIAARVTAALLAI